MVDARDEESQGKRTGVAIASAKDDTERAPDALFLEKVFFSGNVDEGLGNVVVDDATGVYQEAAKEDPSIIHQVPVKVLIFRLIFIV